MNFTDMVSKTRTSIFDVIGINIFVVVLSLYHIIKSREKLHVGKHQPRSANGSSIFKITLSMPLNRLQYGLMTPKSVFGNGHHNALISGPWKV